MTFGCAGSRCSSGMTGAEPISGSRWTAARLRARLGDPAYTAAIDRGRDLGLDAVDAVVS